MQQACPGRDPTPTSTTPPGTGRDLPAPFATWAWLFGGC